MIVFSVTAFVSAFLLFSVQPLIAKMLLPLLGGTPAVWNTCMVFFQILLLAGYYYAHYSTTHLKLKNQLAIQGILLLVPLFLLPLHLPAGWTPPAEGNPIAALLKVLALTIGLPFFVVSTSAPLLQRWFSYTKHASANNPYLLYAASNCGSFLALLSYPFFFERRWRLSGQSLLWQLGYCLLLALFFACAVLTWRNRRAFVNTPLSTSGASPVSAEKLSLQRQIRWVLLALVPSSLMLGVTTYLSTDIAAIPLLWIIPLSLYLLTFIIVFSKKPFIPHALILRLTPLLVILVGLVMACQALKPTEIVLGLHLLLFFSAAMACHGELARDRPSPEQLTRFYLLISLGGALGGIFNSLLAPQIFLLAAEYPVAIILVCLLLPKDASEAASSPWQNRLDYIWPLVLGSLVMSLSFTLSLLTGIPETIRLWLLCGLPPLISYPFRKRRVRFALCIGMWLLTSTLAIEGFSGTLAVRRSFFGIYSVREQVVGNRLFHRLTHGTTLHGKQDRDPERQKEPLTYFSRQGPLGQIINTYEALRSSSEIAVLGLGTGTIACYTKPGQSWTFYEIDVTVKKMAQNPKLFSYLERCNPSAAIILGDARLSLARSANRRYGLIIADAFSSDAVPMHLISREALVLYFSKLGDHGLLAMNISNRYLNLEPVVGNIAQSLGLAALMRKHRDVSPEEYASGITGSVWVVLARQPEDLAALKENPQWRPPSADSQVGVWTDDFANIVSILRFNH